MNGSRVAVPKREKRCSAPAKLGRFRWRDEPLVRSSRCNTASDPRAGASRPVDRRRRESWRSLARSRPTDHTDRDYDRARAPKAASLSARDDVRVQPEQIRRVVLVLERHEPRIVAEVVLVDLLLRLVDDVVRVEPLHV